MTDQRAIFNRTRVLANAADLLFKRLGIDPDLASLAAYEKEVFRPQFFPEQMLIRRVLRGVTRTELSDISGHVRENFTRWEIGERPVPKISTMVDWAQSLGYDLFLRVPKMGDSQSHGAAG